MLPKEAASKALGTGIACGVSFQHFEIANDELGKPILTLHGKAKEIAQTQAVSHIHLSISDEKRYAMATVILVASSEFIYYLSCHRLNNKKPNCTLMKWAFLLGFFIIGYKSLPNKVLLRIFSYFFHFILQLK